MEIWKDIKGYEGLYQVSNLGNVKRLSVLKLNGRYYSMCKEKLIKTVVGNGYKQLTLYLNGEKSTKKVHQLMAENFLNHTPCGMELVVNHIDYNKLNNNIDNLEIVTNRENSNKKHLNSTSKYVGVCWHKAGHKWVAHIQINGKSKHLGLFVNEYDAHLAYEIALKELSQSKV